jgi:murein DD-endopeptidase MepM/ murein hydrolase activator NlpD
MSKRPQPKSTVNLQQSMLNSKFQWKNSLFTLRYIGSGKFLFFKKEGGAMSASQLSLTKLLFNTAALTAIVYSVNFAYSAIDRQVNSAELLETESAVGGVGPLEPRAGKALNDEDRVENDEALKDALMKSEQTSSSDKQVNESSSFDPDDDGLQKITYKVQSGDTLSQIAQKFNINVASIAGSSSITMPDMLRVGQVLQIPSKIGFFYTVKKNDKLALILKKYNVTFEKFLNENSNANTDLLDEGSEIFLPEAKPKNLQSSWLIPVSTRYVTSNYGWRRWPRRAFHKGLDLKAPYISVRAAKSGVVTYAGWIGGYGKVIIIKHGNGYKTLYAHLSRIYTTAGKAVKRGRVIGVSGNTGYSFGPHLHFEITRYGRSINPRRILRGLRN